MTTQQPAIQSAHVHYGLPTVWVAPYRTTDVRGYEVEVHWFYLNGGMISAEGARVKKDGTLSARTQSLMISTPQHIGVALNSLVA